jgi:hypothetical protein
MKNYIGFVNDHSGSMGHLVSAAIKDYNTNITAVKDAASREMLDTVVSVVGLGYPQGRQVTRQVQISNPHVLKPVDMWATNGGTPLLDGIGEMIELLEALPDANNPEVSFLVMTTTDGEEIDSRKYTWLSLKEKIKQKQDTGRWTFVFRVPASGRSRMENLGVPLDNIQSWDTTTAGLEASTRVTTQAMDSYFAARSAGAKGSNSFYANATQVNLAQLNEISAKKISLYVVPDDFNGKWIRDFILTKRMKFLKGAAFFQLTKTESRLSHDKIILLRDRATGKFFGGADARKMLGLPTNQNARLHPGDHGTFDIFIQSKSINRHLVAGTGVAYWEEIGTDFTQAEIDLYTTPKSPVAKPAVVQLPQVAPTNKPTKSPLIPTPRYQYFDTREDARRYCNAEGKPQTFIQNNKTAPKGRRWFV